MASATHAGFFVFHYNKIYLPFTPFLGGQLRLGFYDFDGALRISTADGTQVLHLVNYHSSFCHGCEPGCPNQLEKFSHKVGASRARDLRIRQFLVALSLVLKIEIVYSVVTDCPSHVVESPKNSQDRILGEPRIISYSGLDTCLLFITFLHFLSTLTFLCFMLFKKYPFLNQICLLEC